MTVNKSVLIADDMHECILPLLSEAGYDPVYSPDITREKILRIIKDFDGLVIRSKTFVDQELIDHAPNLKFVARAGAGMDNVDLGYLESKKVEVINAPEGNRDSLAEHTLGLLLSLLHKIHVGYNEVLEGKWDREGNRGIELKGKVVGVYGVGYMGMSFASKLAGFGCEVIGYDKYKDDFECSFIKRVELKELIERTEILSIHIPLDEGTKGLFNETYLRKFKKLKILINTSRGKVLENEGVINLLSDGSLYAAGLDVLENEKLASYSKKEKEQFKTLTSFKNVIITPHVGGWSYESYQRISEVIVEKIRELF